MTRIFFRHMAAVAIVAVFSTTLLMSSEAQARTCKSYYNSGIGKWSVTKAGARLSSRSAWRKKVRALHGAKWGSWTIAANKHYDWCVRSSYSGKTRCKALARACRPF